MDSEARVEAVSTGASTSGRAYIASMRAALTAANVLGKSTESWPQAGVRDDSLLDLLTAQLSTILWPEHGQTRDGELKVMIGPGQAGPPIGGVGTTRNPEGVGLTFPRPSLCPPLRECELGAALSFAQLGFSPCPKRPFCISTVSARPRVATISPT